jgi:hypothetical protein
MFAGGFDFAILASAGRGYHPPNGRTVPSASSWRRHRRNTGPAPGQFLGQVAFVASKAPELRRQLPQWRLQPGLVCGEMSIPGRKTPWRPGIRAAPVRPCPGARRTFATLFEQPLRMRAMAAALWRRGIVRKKRPITQKPPPVYREDCRAEMVRFVLHCWMRRSLASRLSMRSRLTPRVDRRPRSRRRIRQGCLDAGRRKSGSGSKRCSPISCVHDRWRCTNRRSGPARPKSSFD